jgi:hypothetical protein
MAANETVARLLRAQEERLQDDGSGDVVFAVFLEPHDPYETGTPPTMFDKIINYVVGHFQPSPVMVHVELVVPRAPGSDSPVNFATYIGDRSNWRKNKANNASYYLEETANKWRAVPVFGSHAARLAREACDNSCNVQYSLFRYFTAAWGIRSFAAMVPDGDKKPAHCATLTSRILKRAVPGAVRHPSAWYGPSTLYQDLISTLRSHSIYPDSTAIGSAAEMVDFVLRRRDEDVERMKEQDVFQAIRVLTLKTAAASASDDLAMQVMSQKQLAVALLRWSVLKT